MFIAVTFMCLLSGECTFIYDRQLTAVAVCEKRNAAVMAILEADDRVSSYRTTCIPVPVGEQT